MIRKIKTIILGSALLFGTVLTPLAVGGVTHAANKDEVCQGINSIQAGNTNACDPDTGGAQLSTFITRIINILLFLIGVIAVIMIIIGGIRYVTSGGDQSQLSGAKNTILYAVIGLVIAIMAFAIVNFVVVHLPNL